MASENYYDVTEWPAGNPYEDIGEVINSIIADVKNRQRNTDVKKGGKPGAVIYIPPGDYHLRSQVVIDISFLKITGSGHGFTSSSIRFNTSKKEWAALHELWPGGSRILVDLPQEENDEEYKGAAFYVERSGNPRISSVEFSDFCIDGLHFIEDGSGMINPENTYTNGKTGIYVASACDSFRISGMGFVYLEHGLTIYHADALSIHNNFIAECGNCIELRGWGQASKITDNLIGAGYKGYSIYAQNFGGLLITANNVFPRGASSIYFDGVTRSSITSNRLHSFYPGMVVFEGNCSENLVSSNHFLRDHEPWTPFVGVDNGLDDLYGLLSISGNHNSVMANHFSEVIHNIKPKGATPVIIRIVSGEGNYISNNHVVAAEVHANTSDSCFTAQVEALLTAEAEEPLTVTTVLVEKESLQNIILDSGSDAQVVMDKTVNSFRATPTPGV
ncbi:right-handed parallel beta-helix repeat-containing protein [Metabacillus sp. GX 13764]|uniref:NosD domain-containing protein n=1 Tax=Metabacillus kandeliae TaxID=2900151 RepID=UPI001E443BE6|nr:NosD domain-containing protein [Metabacillus kandeliae]MCD7034286.1 right-handed parallel beta-helix repeat-containing protein [Metabacillus kandeliae]